MLLRLPSPLQVIDDPRLRPHRVELLLKRDDLIHPDLSGNKWRKLKYNLRAAAQQGHTTLLTFGGAYSNHIHVTAAAGRWLGFNTIGIIRGEAHTPLNPTLEFARACGMQLDYLSRAAYRDKYNPAQLAAWQARFGPYYLLPEGGSNAQALPGCRELADELVAQTGGAFDVVAVACGTGTTLAGLALGLPPGKQALGVAVLKGAGFLNAAVQNLLGAQDTGNWSLALDFHGGGYARRSPALLDFMADFSVRHQIPLEPIYTAKLLYALYTLIGQGAFAPGTRLIAVHSGGLQGWPQP